MKKTIAFGFLLGLLLTVACKREEEQILSANTAPTKIEGEYKGLLRLYETREPVQITAKITGNGTTYSVRFSYPNLPSLDNILFERTEEGGYIGTPQLNNSTMITLFVKDNHLSISTKRARMGMAQFSGSIISDADTTEQTSLSTAVQPGINQSGAANKSKSLNAPGMTDQSRNAVQPRSSAQPVSSPQSKPSGNK